MVYMALRMQQGGQVFLSVGDDVGGHVCTQGGLEIA